MPQLRTILPTQSSKRTRLTGLPPDLLAQSAKRLRTLALLYAFCFFMSDFLPVMLFAEAREYLFAAPLRWVPSAASIVVALLVAASTWSKRVGVGTALTLGLVFEVVGSFGIAIAQYADPSRYAVAPPWAGLSWVAVWMLAYTVIVPSPPRRALVAALLSVSSVPLVIGLVMAVSPVVPAMGPVPFFFNLVLPYLLIVLLAYVGARVVYSIGTEVTRARELGSYRLEERLGAGGMGEVWRAKHRLLARPAAIKLMRPEVLGGSSPDRQSELHARFEREAQATASLRSPHTIELYDFGVADDGAFYYVMEFLEGFDLETLVEKFGPVPQERAVHLLRQVCHSLAEAHDEGLVHRDIKPANVYVCRHGREVDFVKVLDFGLVKSQGPQGRTELSLTRDHAVGGTPAFMSPEQIISDRPLDGRSDIYAVGCLAYWLVTGKLVFTGRTGIETMMHHAQTRPEPPSQRTEQPISPPFDEAILACLEKKPDDRPATADALSALLAHLEVKSWTPERMLAWWDVHHPAKPRVA
jgi:serine/threonine-protein kinase